MRAEATSTGAAQLRVPPDMEELVENCRSRVRARTVGGPWGETLGRYVAGGKYLRPLVAFAAASAVGERAEVALPAAEAIELVHAASLVHDDIMDRGVTRRGLVALHMPLGVGGAVVAGDALLLDAFHALAAGPSVDGGRLRAAILEMHEHGRACCHGQLRELTEPSAERISSDAYVAIAGEKTGRLFMAAAALGAILAGASAEQVDSLRRFGRHLGIAYQIRDDVLDDLTASGEIARSMAMCREHAALAADQLAELRGQPGVAVLRAVADFAAARGR